ncbi:MAG: IS6 family transposase [Gammaproteobacteria bacterium]|nr:IS6 family transposase [Gammaproteobacteria bacterium]
MISHAIWLYHRFTMNFRDIEDILAAHGVIVSYETIRQWCLKITSPITRQLNLWIAVDQDGCELDVLVKKGRNKKAALRDMEVKIKHNTRQYANNIAEISHQKIRQQQRQMRNFKTIKHAQNFLVNHGLINNLFRHQRHLTKASTYRILREKSFETWTETSCTQNLVLG